MARRELETKVHGGSVVAVKAGQVTHPSQATQAGASVLLIFVGVAALGFIWLLLNSLQGKDVKGVTPIESAADDAVNMAFGGDDVSTVGSCANSTTNLMGQKKKPKSKSKWDRGSSGDCGGKHQSLPTEDMDEDLESPRGRRRSNDTESP